MRSFAANEIGHWDYCSTKDSATETTVGIPFQPGDLLFAGLSNGAPNGLGSEGRVSIDVGDT